MGIILQIGIHSNDHIPSGVIKSGSHGCCLTEIFPETDYHHMTVLFLYFFQELKTSIGGTVIDEEYFIFMIDCTQNFIQLLV